jgi:hypothetical protein
LGKAGIEDLNTMRRSPAPQVRVALPVHGMLHCDAATASPTPVAEFEWSELPQKH